jgi:hypothetical protein
MNEPCWATRNPCGSEFSTPTRSEARLKPPQGLGWAGLAISDHNLGVAAIGAFLHSLAGSQRVAGRRARRHDSGPAFLPARPGLASLPGVDARRTSRCGVIISNCVINLSTDKPRVMREMFPVPRPGGRLGISHVVGANALSPASYGVSHFILRPASATGGPRKSLRCR